MAMPAGPTRFYAAGFLLGVNTSFQKAKNVQGDSAEQFLKDWMKVTQGKADEKLARVVCETPMPPLNGFTVIAASTLRLVPSLSGRCFPAHISLLANTSRGVGELALTLMKKAKELGVEIRFNTKAVALLSDEKTGAVNGVRVKTKEGLSEIHSKFGVVLATGGFSANQAMVTQYIGSGWGQDADPRFAHHRR